MKLGAVRWEEALGELERRHAERRDASSRRLLAEAMSLSAVASEDYVTGARRLARAVSLEPFDPQHLARRALHELRFGRHTEALRVAEDFEARAPGHPLGALLRALASLAAGESARARNIATSYATQASEAKGPESVPLRFLECGAYLREQWKGAEARLDRLPRGAADTPLRVEALLSLLVVHPTSAVAAVQKRLDQGFLPRASPAEAMVRDALRWMTLDAAGLSQALAAVPPSTRREEALLLFFTLGEAWRAMDTEARARALRTLHRATPERLALRRLYVGALTRLAVERFGKENYAGALQAVQLCMALEPHEPTHHQNRAAALTFLSDHDAYLDAWAALDRHHARLALLGDVDAPRRAMRTHRMFAQQARLTPREPGKPSPEYGIFRLEQVRDDAGASRAVLRVNQGRIEGDPEQLRQWMHHRRAELVFAHAALGGSVGRALLWPEDAALARKRAEGLATDARSLAVLVPGEGDELALVLGDAWQRQLGGLLPRYGAAPQDDAVAQLQVQHLETLGDLALLCIQLRPVAERPDAVHELVEFALAEMSFFDPRALYAALDDRERVVDVNLRVLHHAVMQRVGGDDDRPTLTEPQREGTVRWLCAQLLIALAIAQVNGGGRFSAGAADRATRTLERAREIDPTCASVELHLARILLVGQRDDDARAALGRYHRLARDDGRDDTLAREAEEVKRVLDQRRRTAGGAPGPARDAHTSARPEAPTTTSAEGLRRELEDEVERFPSGIAPYEALARYLAGAGSWDEAVACAERAVSRCLSREGQLRARALHLEMLGLQHAGAAHAHAVRLYLAGSREALESALAALEDDRRPYAADYVLGLCHVAKLRRAEAMRAFTRAVERCGRPLHLAVLRPLADDVDGALVQHAAATLSDTVASGRIDAAFAEFAQLWARCERREACLIELTRLHHASAVASLTGAAPTPPPLVFTGHEAWAPRLRSALGEVDALARVEALCALTAEAHPPSAARAEVIARKARSLQGQLRLAQAVGRAGEHLQAGRLDAALEALEAVRAEGETDPRWLRVYTIVLLRLERFDEADRAAAELHGATHAAAVELTQRYPELAFRGRIGAATRKMRADDLDGAGRVLAGATATQDAQRRELAFTAAFRLVLVARRCDADGARREAERALHEAIDLLEPLLSGAKAAGDARITDLYAQVERDLSHREKGR